MKKTSLNKKEYILFSILFIISLLLSFYIFIPEKIFPLLIIDNNLFKKVPIIYINSSFFNDYSYKKPNNKLNVNYDRKDNNYKNGKNEQIFFNPYFVNYDIIFNKNTLYESNLNKIKFDEINSKSIIKNNTKQTVSKNNIKQTIVKNNTKKTVNKSNIKQTKSKNNIKPEIVKFNFIPESFDNIVIINKKNIDNEINELSILSRRDEISKINKNYNFLNDNYNFYKYYFYKGKYESVNLIKTHFIFENISSNFKLYHRIKRAYLERKCTYIFLNENITNSFYKKILNLKNFPVNYNYSINMIFSYVFLFFLLYFFVRNLKFIIDYIKINWSKIFENSNRINILKYFNLIFLVFILIILFNFFYSLFYNNCSKAVFYFYQFFLNIILFFLFFNTLFNYILFTIGKINFTIFVINTFLTGFTIHFIPQLDEYSFLFLKNHLVIFYYFSPFLFLVIIFCFIEIKPYLFNSLHFNKKFSFNKISYYFPVVFNNLKNNKKLIIQFTLIIFIILVFFFRLFFDRPFPLEMSIRDFLEKIFFIRPRFKEIIFYPFLFYFVLVNSSNYIKNSINENVINLFKKEFFLIFLGYFPVISFLNSSYHFHTPFYITIYRSAIPFAFYIILIYIFKVFVKKKFFTKKIKYNES